jgi:hypothetical protein
MKTGEKHYAFEKAPRCGAKTKHNNGNPCRCPAIRGKKRCRIHGGAKGSGGQLSNYNALKHGQTTAKVKIFRKSVKRVLSESVKLTKGLC